MKRTTIRKLAGLGTSLLLAAVVVFIYVDGRQQPPGPVLETTVALPQLAWQAGDVQRYSVSMQSTVQLELLPELGPVALVQDMDAFLNLRVFPVSDTGTRVGFQLDQVNYRVAGNPVAELQQRLAPPFVATFAPDGRIVDVEFPQEVDATERTMLAEIIRAVQLVLPAAGETQFVDGHLTWTATETHNTGQYLARYQLADDGSIVKEKLRYTSVDQSLGNAGLKQSAITLRLEPGTSWITTALADEHMLIGTGDSAAIDNKLRIEIQLTDTTPSADLALLQGASWLAMLADAEKAAVGVVPEATEDELASLQERRAQRLESLLADLNGDKADDPTVLREIIDLLVDEPEFAYRVRDVLDAPGLNASAEPRLIHALARAGTRQAQEILSFMSEDPAEEHFNRIRAVSALGSTEKISKSSLDALVRMTEIADVSGSPWKLQETALLAAGSVGRLSRENDLQLEGEVNELLAGKLASASGERDIEIALKAIGNSADSSFADSVQPLLDHGSPAVRATAAETMGRIKADNAVQALTTQLRSERDPTVRASIAVGLYKAGNASTESLALVNSAIAGEPVVRTRFYMVRYLGENLEIYPDAMDTIAYLARNDQANQVRRYAAGLILKDRSS
ncbi:MAG: hypothetical protein HKO55_04100 [Gammaproteobacteria bacterium]|nr:hypothetical protein [Gammaproteobacteria bacterium]